MLRGISDSTTSPRNNDDDVDLLSSSLEVQKIIWAASKSSGNIPVDIYFNDRPSFKKYHYYPPTLADDILNNKDFCPTRKCYFPRERYLLLSLLYHVLYHKGILKSYNLVNEDYPIDTSPHYDQICKLIKELQIKLDLEIFKIDSFLRTHQFSMPFDLLLKWPNQHSLLQLLHKRLSSALKIEYENYSKFPLVFIVRSDASDNKHLDLLLNEISKELKISECIKLSTGEINNLTRCTRGGNWVERKNRIYEKILPTHFIITEFKSLEELNFFCREKLSQFKNEIRNNLNNNSKSQIFGIHSADNYLESLEYITALKKNLSKSC